jgi:hypothetical protein
MSSEELQHTPKSLVFEGKAQPIIFAETMQEEDDKNSSLVVYEICFPPYQEGRYENIKN